MIVAHQVEVIVAPNCSTIEPRSRDDRATVARQSGHNRASIVVNDLFFFQPSDEDRVAAHDRAFDEDQMVHLYQRVSV